MTPVRKVVRHELPEVTWPTAEEARAGLMFQPITLNRVVARHRTWVPAMVPWRATEDGFVTDSVLDWYGRLAAGKPGVLVVEATGIRDIKSGPLLRIGHERFLPGLTKLVQRVQDQSEGQTRLFIQIIDFLTIKRRPPKEKFFGRFLNLTQAHRDALAARDEQLQGTPDEQLREALIQLDDAELREILTAKEYQDYSMGYRETVNDIHLPHIAELPQVLPDLFANAAGFAKAAGFDGVELHYAHAYTMAGFLSRLNTRQDGYGGSPANRIKVPLAVLERVRQQVGSDYCVGVRLLGDEAITGGSGIEDASHYSVELAQSGVDYISVSKGGKFEDAKQPNVGDAVYPYTGPSGLECMPTVRSDDRGPFGRNVHLARDIRAAIRAAGLTTPVVTSGGICHFHQAEEILRRGDADIVAAARQSLADPDWFLKVELGRGDEIRRCIYTNYCEGLDQKHKQVTCQRWDRDFSDGATTDTPRSKDGKRRLVAPLWSTEPGSDTKPVVT
ncbi:MAG: oxidoreductase [Planctomycetota bacterium]|jgi:2,4-dienoyl-CoA reductase-like NADH-dependent reductase (Old Yellow Enzyme family)